MRYLFLLLALAGCQPAIAAPPSKETIVEALERYHKLTDGKVDTLATKVDGLAETVGNGVAEQEATKEEVKALRADVAEIKSLLTLPNEIAVPVPPAADPPPPVKVDAPPVESDRKVVSRLTFQGKPIDAQSWLNRSVAFVDIKGDIDAHLRDHGLEGDFSGFTRHQKLHLHSVAHTYGVPLKSSKVVVNAAIVLPRSSNCPNGNCPLQYGYQQRSRLFGRWR